jgi:hypothetical protein
MGLIIDPATFGGFDEHLKYPRCRSRPLSPMGFPRGEQHGQFSHCSPLYDRRAALLEVGCILFVR